LNHWQKKPVRIWLFPVSGYLCARPDNYRGLNLKIKTSTMKKVFAIFAIAGILVACGNKGDKKADDMKDSANNMIDSAKNMMNNMTDSATNMMNNMADSASKMIDKAIDTAKSKM
jgi:TATA-box binding protein (TBP) (component of TFIID and TFIIIB)